MSLTKLQKFGKILHHFGEIIRPFPSCRALDPRRAVEGIIGGAKGIRAVEHLLQPRVRVPFHAGVGVKELGLVMGVERMDGVDKERTFAIFERFRERVSVLGKGREKNLDGFYAEVIQVRQSLFVVLPQKQRRGGNTRLHKG